MMGGGSKLGTRKGTPCCLYWSKPLLGKSVIQRVAIPKFAHENGQRWREHATIAVDDDMRVTRLSFGWAIWRDGATDKLVPGT